MVAYEDVAAAIDWLGAAFGFREKERFEDGGRVVHAVLAHGDDEVHLGWVGPSYQSPRRHAENCTVAHEWQQVPWVIDGVVVEIGDLDAHIERARQGGAEILRIPEVQPFGRLYAAADHEGHRWMFVEPGEPRGRVDPEVPGASPGITRDTTDGAWVPGTP
jgi:PhnB protein